jgi:hypothetical protein
MWVNEKIWHMNDDKYVSTGKPEEAIKKWRKSYG